ncbi:hypothetical protein [uncultured Hymenobacter sp.]|uniref:hypothetical protein n=1 Tax=uncultured Hymenobacter sp. TaxID=170016 RepID=UPI0035CBFE8E
MGRHANPVERSAHASLPMLAWAQATPTPNRADGYGVLSSAPSLVDPGNTDETEVNILSSYYEQDGNYGAVQGGVGTQELTDVSPTIILNVPLDSVTRLSANLTDFLSFHKKAPAIVVAGAFLWNSY